MNILSVALRNVLRSRRRSLITTGAMAFAGMIMIFYASFLEGFLHSMERNAVGMDLGDIQIHAVGYREDPDLYKRIEKAADLMNQLRAQDFRVSARLYGFGLAAAGSASSGVWLRGVDLRNESTVTQIHKHTLSGTWLEGTDPKGVVIGRKLARTLDVKVGDDLVIVSQATDGSIANDLYTVRGILKSIGEEVDRSGLFMVDRTFRDLMVLPEGVHEIAIMRQDRTADLQHAARQVTALSTGLSVMDWQELQPVLARVLDITDASLFIMLLIAYTAIAMVVLNAMLMSVFERIRELGVMKAIGLSPWQVAALIFTEAMIQAAAACVLSIAFGVPFSLYYQTHGIDLSARASTGTLGGVALDPVLYTRVTPESVVTPLLFLLGIAALAVIYPAIKAAVIRPAEALRYR